MILDTICLALVVLGVSAFFSALFEFLFENYPHKKSYWIVTFIIFSIISISLINDSRRDDYIQNFINNANSIEELQETLIEKEVFGE